MSSKLIIIYYTMYALCFELVDHAGVPAKANGHPPQLPIKPVLLHIQEPLVIRQLLQDNHIIRLLRRLGRPRHRAQPEGRLVQLLPRMHHQHNMHVVGVAEGADGGDGLVHQLKLVQVVGGLAAQHELQVVEDDEASAVVGHILFHGMQDGFQRGRSKDVHQMHRETGQPLVRLFKQTSPSILDAIVTTASFLPIHVYRLGGNLLEHRLDQPAILHLKTAPKHRQLLCRQIQAHLGEDRRLAAAGWTGEDGQFPGSEAFEDGGEAGEGEEVGRSVSGGSAVFLADGLLQVQRFHRHWSAGWLYGRLSYP